MPKQELNTLAVKDRNEFADWLSRHQSEAQGIWLMIPKKGGEGSGPTYSEAVVEALRYGWIDGQKQSHDDDYYLQRFTPRASRSKWSKINRQIAEELIASGKMERSGLAQVEAAKEDGRWDAAYDSQRTASVPPDLEDALAANPKARAFFETLNPQNRYAILYRIQDAKREDTRARRIKKFVEMCARGETIH